MFREYDHVEGGTLVYDVRTEPRANLLREATVGRQLLGFAKVTDWDKIRSELTRRAVDGVAEADPFEQLGGVVFRLRTVRD